MRSMILDEKFGSEERGLNVSRMSSLSDDVFAVAMTLLVLSITVPVIAPGVVDTKLPAELAALWPRYLGYAVSFLLIGTFWMVQHQLFRYIKRFNDFLLFLNLLFLMCIVFLPFPTGLISAYWQSRSAIIFYAASMAVTVLMLCVLWVYAGFKGRLTEEDLDRRTFRNYTIGLLSMSLIFVVSIGIAFINVRVAKYFWLLVLLNDVAFYGGRIGTRIKRTVT